VVSFRAPRSLPAGPSRKAARSRDPARGALPHAAIRETGGTILTNDQILASWLLDTVAETIAQEVDQAAEGGQVARVPDALPGLAMSADRVVPEAVRAVARDATDSPRCRAGDAGG
jgi:hypothetical protein